eukprot:NODE_2815_length_1034_cov_17.896447_g2355_i0.p2 GENE.NODE_2815_length_1034_cov_17.896447_g2355_i0~~NODE_2815_length_1034_cov_17.896447_g2355_i0.p2  ORF type:complete len:109 (-),score=2.05 NODE_2815_length_1034_cov_17.896447_g2355_i0:132-458(-)
MWFGGPWGCVQQASQRPAGGLQQPLQRLLGRRAYGAPFCDRAYQGPVTKGRAVDPSSNMSRWTGLDPSNGGPDPLPSEAKASHLQGPQALRAWACPDPQALRAWACQK